MENQLDKIAKSYDEGIQLGRKGINSYENFPEYIAKDPDYPLFQKARDEGLDSDSGRKEVLEFLSPTSNMKFIDLGCCLNLMFKGYDKWTSMYHGVDISSETISLLNEFVVEKKISIGSFVCCSIHNVPFEDEYFDIGACIGVLEYFEKDFVFKALKEAFRILKPNAKFVIDIPDNVNPMRRFMNLIEEYQGRPDKFDMSPKEFESILSQFFYIEKIDKIEPVAMIQYFLKRK